MPKVNKAVTAFFKKIGAKGGRTTAERYGLKERRSWPRGGPRFGTRLLVFDALKSGPQSLQEIIKIVCVPGAPSTKISRDTQEPILPTAASVSQALKLLKKDGYVKNVKRGIWKRTGKARSHATITNAKTQNKNR